MTTSSDAALRGRCWASCTPNSAGRRLPQTNASTYSALCGFTAAHYLNWRAFPSRATTADATLITILRVAVCRRIRCGCSERTLSSDPRVRLAFTRRSAAEGTTTHAYHSLTGRRCGWTDFTGRFLSAVSWRSQNAFFAERHARRLALRTDAAGWQYRSVTILRAISAAEWTFFLLVYSLL